MGSKKTQVIALRLENEVIERLKQRAGGLSLAEYIKRVIAVGMESVNTEVGDVNTTLTTRLEKQGLELDGNRVSLAPGLTRSPLKPSMNTRIPWYSPHIHGPGDTVKMTDASGRVVVVTVPEMDEEGSPLPEKEATGRLVSSNLSRPSFQPDPKPEKKRK